MSSEYEAVYNAFFHTMGIGICIIIICLITIFGLLLFQVLWGLILDNIEGVVDGICELVKLFRKKLKDGEQE